MFCTKNINHDLLKKVIIIDCELFILYNEWKTSGKNIVYVRNILMIILYLY